MSGTQSMTPTLSWLKSISTRYAAKLTMALPRNSSKLCAASATGLVAVKAPRTLRVRLVLWSVALEAVLLLGFAVALTLSLRNVQMKSVDEALLLAASQLNSAIDLQGTRFILPPADEATLRGEG